MGTDRFTYADVTNDERAARYVQVASSVTNVIPLDFVGHSLTELAGWSYVCEIRRTPERDAFVSFSSAKFENVSCSTLLEDGTVVTTSTAPPLRAFTTLAVVLDHHPRLRIFHGAVFTRSVAELLRRHRERVSRYESAVVPCDTMREYFAIRLRCSDVTAKQLAIGSATVVPWTIFATLGMIALAIVQGSAIASVLAPVVALALIWAFVYVALPVIYRIAIRAPLPERVARLLDRAARAPSGRVPATASW